MIIIIGIAGSGKSTQGQLLAKKLGGDWLSIGQLLRDNIQDINTRNTMLAGEVLDDQIVLPLLAGELKKRTAANRPLVLDGSPRTMRQAEMLAQMAKRGEIDIEAIIHLTATKETVKSRLLARGRPDDTEQAITQRFMEYDQTILPIINYFKEQGIAVYEINGEAGIDECAEAIASILDI